MLWRAPMPLQCNSQFLNSPENDIYPAMALDHHLMNFLFFTLGVGRDFRFHFQVPPRPVAHDPYDVSTARLAVGNKAAAVGGRAACFIFPDEIAV